MHAYMRTSDKYALKTTLFFLIINVNYNIIDKIIIDMRSKYFNAVFGKNYDETTCTISIC
jgi:hypothetical protein